jgi:glycerol transport system permease protein
MNKVQNNKAWWLVLPVFLLVAFSAVIPMMTVVNYSVQDIFDQSSRYFVGADWYRQVLLDPRCTMRCCASSSTRPACC